VALADASRLWQQYLQAAGCDDTAPSFDEVVMASKQAHLGVLRPEAAQKLQQQLAELHRQYLLRNLPEALVQPAGQSAGGTAGLAALLGQADPGQLLLGHLRGVEAHFGIERRADSELGSASASSTILQTLQPLATAMGRMMRSDKEGGGAAAPGARPGAKQLAEDSDDDSDAGAGSGSGSGSSGSDEDDGAWQQLLARVESGDLTASSSADSGGSPGYLHQYGLAPGSVPPPYPGARKLLRWQQTMMLHAAAALAEHPLDRVVRLHVNAAELQQEAGLSDEGLQHVLRIVGKR
jgi:hypothetical protein